MVKRANSWDDEHTIKVENAEKIIGRPICGSKIPEPRIEDDEPVTEFEKRYQIWERMPFCKAEPVSSENGRCEKHGGLSTGAGQRVPKKQKMIEFPQDENWLPEPSESEIILEEEEPITTMIPVPNGVEITEIKSLEHPYYIGERILTQLTEKGHITPELITPLIQLCDNCIYRDDCPKISHVTGECYYERRMIFETFGEEFTRNPYSDPELVRDLAMAKAELYRTQILMNVIGISQSSKQKINQEKKALRVQILALRDKLDMISPRKMSDMSNSQTDMLVKIFNQGIDENEITLIQKEISISKKKKDENVIEGEIIIDEG